MRARVIKSRERKWYRIGEIYLVRNTEKYEGIWVQLWNTDENIPHPDVIMDGDYQLITQNLQEYQNAFYKTADAVFFI